MWIMRMKKRMMGRRKRLLECFDWEYYKFPFFCRFRQIRLFLTQINIVCSFKIYL